MAIALPCHLLGSRELFGNRGGGLIVVEKHVASRARNTVGNREPNARAGRGGRESRNARPRACNSSMTGAMLFASAVNLLPI